MLLKTTILLYVVLFACQGMEVRGNALTNPRHLFNAEAETKGWPSLPTSWSLPSLPLFSVNSLFSDKNDDVAILKVKVKALEESQKEVLELLKQLIIAANNSMTCNVTSNSTQSSSDQMTPEESENKDVDKGKVQDGSVGKNETVHHTTESDESTTIRENHVFEIASSVYIDQETVLPSKMNGTKDSDANIDEEPQT